MAGVIADVLHVPWPILMEMEMSEFLALTKLAQQIECRGSIRRIMEMQYVHSSQEDRASIAEALGIADNSVETVHGLKGLAQALGMQ